MKIREKLAITMVFTGLAFWLLENIFFGWNMTPQSIQEMTCDWLVLIMVLGGFIIKPASVTINHTVVTIKEFRDGKFVVKQRKEHKC